MPLFTTLADLSPTPASNPPDGSVDAPSTIDDQLRLLGSFIAQLRDGNLTMLTRVVAANGNITAADNGYMVKVTAAGVTLACDTPAALSGRTIYFTASQHGVLLTGTFANLDGTNTAQTRAVPRGYAANLRSDGAGLRLDLIAPAALYQHSPPADNYNFILVDQGAEIIHASTDPVARWWVIPQQATVPFPRGTTFALVVQNGAGAITLNVDVGTLIWAGSGTVGNRNLSPNALASVTLIDPATNTWMLSGAGVS